MNQEEARSFLGVNTIDRDLILEGYHKKTFEIKNFIFRTTLIPLLAKKRSLQLWKLAQALEVVLDQETITEELYSSSLESFKSRHEEAFSQFKPEEIKKPEIKEAMIILEVGEEYHFQELISSYERKMAQLKLGFSSSYDAQWIAFFLGEMIELELAFQQLLYNPLKEVLEEIKKQHQDLINLDVKNAEGLLSSHVKKGLEQLNWMNILSSHFSVGLLQEKVKHVDEKESIKSLFTEVLRCEKSLKLSI